MKLTVFVVVLKLNDIITNEAKLVINKPYVYCQYIRYNIIYFNISCRLS